MSSLKAIATAALVAAFGILPAVACDYSMEKSAEAEQRPVAAAPATDAQAATTTAASAVPAEPTLAPTTQTAESTAVAATQPRTN